MLPTEERYSVHLVFNTSKKYFFFFRYIYKNCGPNYQNCNDLLYNFKRPFLPL